MAEETLATANGMFKETYAPNLIKFEPDFAILQQDIPFKEDQKVGKKHIKAVEVRRGGQMTWASGSTAGTAFDLATALPSQSEDAEFTPSTAVLPWQIAYTVLTRSITSQQAFENQFDRTVYNMKARARFEIECAMLYGGSSIGAISVIAGATTTRTYTLSKASWAVGLWAQMEGQSVDAYDPTLVTKRNTNAAIVVTLVDPTLRKITVTGNAADLTATLVNDVFVPWGKQGNWFSGIDVITQNTGSLFGIDGATYGIWRGNTYDAGSVPITMQKITAAAALSVGRGAMGPRNVYISHYSWNDLNSDEAALVRRTDEGKGEVQRGSDSITYIGPNGRLVIKPHPMVKAGEAFILDTAELSRIGSTDVTFNLPGADGSSPNFFQHISGKAGCEIRCMTDQCLAVDTISHHTKITGIVPLSLV